MKFYIYLLINLIYFYLVFGGLVSDSLLFNLTDFIYPTVITLWIIPTYIWAVILPYILLNSRMKSSEEKQNQHLDLGAGLFFCLIGLAIHLLVTYNNPYRDLAVLSNSFEEKVEDILESDLKVVEKFMIEDGEKVVLINSNLIHRDLSYHSNLPDWCRAEDPNDTRYVVRLDYNNEETTVTPIGNVVRRGTGVSARASRRTIWHDEFVLLDLQTGRKEIVFIVHGTDYDGIRASSWNSDRKAILNKYLFVKTE